MRVRFFWEKQCSDGAPGLEIHFDFENDQQYERVLEVEEALLSIGLKFDTGSLVDAKQHKVKTRDWEFDLSLRDGDHFLWDEASKQWRPIQARNGTRIKHVSTQP